jgi:hypothetical protein
MDYKCSKILKIISLKVLSRKREDKLFKNLKKRKRVKNFTKKMKTKKMIIYQRLIISYKMD